MKTNIFEETGTIEPEISDEVRLERWNAGLLPVYYTYLDYQVEANEVQEVIDRMYAKGSAQHDIATQKCTELFYRYIGAVEF